MREDIIYVDNVKWHELEHFKKKLKSMPPVLFNGKLQEEKV